MSEPLPDGDLCGCLDLAGLGEPGAEPDHGDLDAVIESDRAVDVHCGDGD